MKHINIAKRIAVLMAASVVGLAAASAQGIVVTKTDGTTQKYSESSIEQMWLEGYNGQGTKGLVIKLNSEQQVIPADELEKVSLYDYPTLNISETPAEAVDLGLPSGRKWASYNVGASSPEDCGGYFAWGELLEKGIYSWATYKYSGDSNTTLNKYNTDSAWGKVDNMIDLTCDDDVAHQRWGGGWRMPTHDEQVELVIHCTKTRETVNGIEGTRFTGPNGNSIFLPLAGIKSEDKLLWKGSQGQYWASTVSHKTPENSLNFDYDGWVIFMYGNNNNTAYSTYNRYCGLNVRPVRDDLTISQGDDNMVIGQKLTFQIVTGSGNYTVTSSNPAVVTAELQGTTVILTGIGDGETTITVADTEYNQTASFVITIIPANSNVPKDAGPIDLGLPSGTRWATMNIGATAPEQTGIYVAWGEVEPRTNYNECTYNGNLTDIAGSDYDVAHQLWGGQWRMPTREQLKELKDNCNISKDVVNGINGLWFIGPNGNKVFFPYTHYIWLSGNGENKTSDCGFWGTAYLWSSTTEEADSSTSYGMKFGYMDLNDPEQFKRIWGMPVRAVMP